MKFRAFSTHSRGGTTPPQIPLAAHLAPGTRTGMEDESGPVVVAVDGRPASLVAVEWAAAEASVQGAPLRIVHVFAPEWSLDVVAGATPTWNGQVRDAALEMLTEAMSHAHAVAPQLHVSAQLCSGSAPRALHRSTTDASLLVLGRNPSRRRWRNPLPDRLARRTRVPLAMIGLSQGPTPDAGGVGNEHAARVLLILDEPALPMRPWPRHSGPPNGVTPA